MKVTFEKVDEQNKEEAIIKAVERSIDIDQVIDILEGNSKSIAVVMDGKNYLCKLGTIYYIESVDKRTYVYTKDNCYETKYRLYELEEILGGYFSRCSKSLIINLKKIKNVKSELGGRMNATMLNDEKLLISRGYVKEIKRRLDI